MVRKAPELKFTLPGGKQKRLSDYHGKVVSLEFIQTTNQQCQTASKVQSRLQNELGADDFEAVDIAVNTADEAVVKAFIKEMGCTFPVGWMNEGTSLANVFGMMNFLGMKGSDKAILPQLVLLDRAGNIRYQSPTAGDEAAVAIAKLRSRVLQLIGPLHKDKPKP